MTAQVFLDASFWIALRDPREPRHSQARQAAGRLLRQRIRFVFTSFVLAETHAYFSRSPAMRSQILDDAQQNPALHWEPVPHSDETAAVATEGVKPGDTVVTDGASRVTDGAHVKLLAPGPG